VVLTPFVDRISNLERKVAALRSYIFVSDEAAPDTRVFDMLSDGVAIIDPSGTVAAVNLALCHLTGEERSALIGCLVTDLFRVDPSVDLAAQLARFHRSELDRVWLPAAVRAGSGAFVAGDLAIASLHDQSGASKGTQFRFAQRERNLPIAVGDHDELSRLRERNAKLEGLCLVISGALADVGAEWLERTSEAPRLESSMIARLSRRELEIVRHLLEGLRPPSIAREMHLSTSTIRSHLTLIFRKLGVGSQEELVRVLRGQLTSR
jgi:DNA-binding CsgD family transcriptional regulator